MKIILTDTFFSNHGYNVELLILSYMWTKMHYLLNMGNIVRSVNFHRPFIPAKTRQKVIAIIIHYNNCMCYRFLIGWTHGWFGYSSVIRRGFCSAVFCIKLQMRVKIYSVQRPDSTNAFSRRKSICEKFCAKWINAYAERTNQVSREYISLRQCSIHCESRKSWKFNAMESPMYVHQYFAGEISRDKFRRRGIGRLKEAGRYIWMV
jgi:hypothetical protein